VTCDLNSNYNLFVSLQPDELPCSVGMTKAGDTLSSRHVSSCDVKTRAVGMREAI